MDQQKFVFIGYMASGKSAIAREVASRLDLKLIDLDRYIEEKENLSVSNIFKEKGEIYFRKRETFYLNELLESPISFILSVGGGTPCYAGNIELIKSKSISFYLKASIHTIYSRLKNEKNQRPLVAEISDENLKEYIAKHLFERAPYYEQVSKTIIVDEKSIPEIGNEIVNYLK